MRTLLATLLLMSLSACGSSTGPGGSYYVHRLPATVTLRVGQSVVAGGAGIAFQGVVSDSRCPSDVVCVQAGNAEVQMTIGPTVGLGPIRLVTLNTNTEPRSSGPTLGVNITLLQLLPEPVSTTPTTDYHAVIRIDAVP